MPDKSCLSHCMRPIRSWWRCTKALNFWMTSLMGLMILHKKVIIASLTSETMGKLINRIQGLLCIFWYQIYQAWLWECMLNLLASITMSTSILIALPGKLDIKRHSPSILYFLDTSAWTFTRGIWTWAPTSCAMTNIILLLIWTFFNALASFALKIQGVSLISIEIISN